MSDFGVHSYVCLLIDLFVIICAYISHVSCILIRFFSTDYGYMIPQSTASWSDINVNLPSGVYNIPHGKKAEINRQDTTDFFKFNEER